MPEWYKTITFSSVYDQTLDNLHKSFENLHSTHIPTKEETEKYESEMNTILDARHKYGLDFYNINQVKDFESEIERQRRIDLTEKIKQEEQDNQNNSWSLRLFVKPALTNEETTGSSRFKNTVNEAFTEPDSQKATQVYKDAAKDRILETAAALSIPIASGALGNVPAWMTNGIWAGESAYDLISPEGVPKTINLLKQKQWGPVIQSAAGDLFNASILKGTSKAFVRPFKSLRRIPKSTYTNRTLIEELPAEWQDAIVTNPVPAMIGYRNGGTLKYQKGKIIKTLGKAAGKSKEASKLASKGVFTRRNPDYYVGKPKDLMFDFNRGRKTAWGYLGSQRKAATDTHNKEILARITKDPTSFQIEQSPQQRSMIPMQKPQTGMQMSDGSWVDLRDDGFFLYQGQGNEAGLTFKVKGAPEKDQMYLTTDFDIDDTAFHEYLHRGNMGVGFNGPTQWLYNWKNRSILKPGFEKFRDGYLTNPEETAVNLLEIGRRADILNTPYPGSEKAKMILQDIIKNDLEKGSILDQTKWETKPKRVWDALQGKYMGLIPIGIGSGLMLNNNKNE